MNQLLQLSGFSTSIVASSPPPSNLRVIVRDWRLQEKPHYQLLSTKSTPTTSSIEAIRTTFFLDFPFLTGLHLIVGLDLIVTINPKTLRHYSDQDLIVLTINSNTNPPPLEHMTPRSPFNHHQPDHCSKPPTDNKPLIVFKQPCRISDKYLQAARDLFDHNLQNRLAASCFNCHCRRLQTLIVALPKHRWANQQPVTHQVPSSLFDEEMNRLSLGSQMIGSFSDLWSKLTRLKFDFG